MGKGSEAVGKVAGVEGEGRDLSLGVVRRGREGREPLAYRGL